MPNTVEIENIEEMRRQEGIDDIELRVEIRRLKVGDFVNLTLVSGTKSIETALVRITSIRGDTYRGKLVKKPTSSGLRELEIGASFAFTTDHIHSVWKRHEVQT